MSYFSNETEAVFSRMEESPSIVIFGHANPDGDCVGSVLGLKHALQELFPDKKVYGVGTRPSYIRDFCENADIIPDSIIEESLCVMVDLSDIDRVEDQRIQLSHNIVCIDHHIQDAIFPYPVLRDSQAPSATYVIAKALLERYHQIPASAANPLFMGLVTDSGRFQFDSSPDTLMIAAELVKAGADYKKLYNNLYRQSSRDLKLRSYIYTHYQFEGKVAYFYFPRKDYLALGLTEQEVGCKVNLISLLDEHPLWVQFTELEIGLIRVEFRSNGFYNVQEVARQFGGGGHLAASGALIDSPDKVKDVLAALNKINPVK